MASMREQVWIMGHGYEGRTIDEYIGDLYAWHADVVVDVRLNAISRKKGFSKTALRAALADAGIRFEHRPELGNPKDNRGGFWEPGTPAHGDALVRFEEMLHGAAAAEAVRDVAEMARTERVVLLCFEASERCCHRQVVLERVRKLTARQLVTSV